MPISTRWYDDNHKVIFQLFEGNWTWADLSREQERMRIMAESVPYKVILFSDMSQTSFMPQGNVLSQGRAAFAKLPNNIAQIVIAIQSRMIEVFTNIAIDMVPSWRKRVKFVKTVEEAQKVVAEALATNTTGTGAA